MHLGELVPRGLDCSLNIYAPKRFQSRQALGFLIQELSQHMTSDAGKLKEREECCVRDSNGEL